MKRTFLTIVTLFAAMSVSAQYYPDGANKDILHIGKPRNVQRVEFNAPQIDGYTPYKADLHTHTIFSDGHLSMEARVKEAWADGLDVMAVTEHLEWRPLEKNFVKYFAGYMPKGTKAQAYGFVSKNRPADKSSIKVDFNIPVQIAIKEAKMYDITIIPGIEITRKEGLYSHFNALFTKDNNEIYAFETIQSLRNAKAQGAFIMHNHPGWKHPDMKPTKFEKEVYKEGLLDGIEVINSSEFYPKAIDRANKYNLCMTASTDIHYPTSEAYSGTGSRRNMTIIYAKDKSLASLREAMEAHRTLCYSHGTLAGGEELLRKFFMASVTAHKTAPDTKGKKYVVIKNTSSVDWLLWRDGERMVELKGNSSIMVSWDDKKCNTFTVMNTWYGDDKHLVIDLFGVAK